MYLKIEDFISEWNQESESTVKVFSKIPDNKKAEKVNDNVRSLDRMAWHITQTLTEMPHKAGIVEEDVLDNKPVPETFSEIIEIYKKYSDNLIDQLQKKWKDEDLTIEMEIYGMTWEKRKILSALVNHQVHHRGQMTVVMRLLDIEVPGVYGPSKEEWVKYGMKAEE